MTRTELETIRARAEKATAGPWKATQYGDVLDASGCRPPVGWCNAQPDAVFAAHARTDVPALIAEVERLRGDLAGAAEILATAPGDKARAARLLIEDALSDEAL